MASLSAVYTPFMRRVFSIYIHRVRVCALVGAVLLYGGFGSPTPEHPGVLEAVIGVLLVVGVGVPGVWSAFTFTKDAPGWQRAGQIFLIFGLSVPLAGGVLAGHAPGLIVRDVAAFLFMGLALFLCPHFANGAGRVVQICVVALGVLFGLRAGFDIPVLGRGDELFYLANMPSVLFAAIFCAGAGVREFMERFNARAVLRMAALFVLAGICIWPMIETQQRASLGVFALSMFALVVFYVRRASKRALILIVLCGFAAMIFTDEMQNLWVALSRKTELVGGNMRAAEWASVWVAISGNPASMLVGQGWGAVFASPAVADIKVNFTHGLLSSLLLKGGVIGLALGLGYLCFLARILWRHLRVNPFVVLALAGPIAIDVLLYASFKSLDFGLVLALVPGLLYSKRV